MTRRTTTRDVECAVVLLVSGLRESGRDLAALVSHPEARAFASDLGVPVAAWDPERRDYGPLVAFGADHAACYGGWVLTEHRPGSTGQWNPFGSTRSAPSAFVREIHSAVDALRIARGER